MSVVAKPLIDLNGVWYEWIQDSKMLQKGKARLRRAALCGDRSYYGHSLSVTDERMSTKYWFNCLGEKFR